MFAGLGHDAVVGGDDEDHAVNARGAGDHGLDEVLVAGDVDDANLQVCDCAGGKTQFDGHAAFLFLLEEVGVAAGKQLDQGGLAVIDVPRGTQSNIDSRCRHISARITNNLRPRIPKQRESATAVFS